MSVVFPAINSSDSSIIENQLNLLRISGIKNVHIDVSDGIFSPPLLFSNPEHVSFFTPFINDFFLEAHLMVKNPIPFVDAWRRIGARRIIVHVESIPLSEFTDFFFSFKKNNPTVQIGIAVSPDTDVEYVIPYVAVCGFILCLAVSPGFSGQPFQENILKKIERIRKEIPSSIIEIDGGINETTAILAKNAGADILVSNSFLFSSSNLLSSYLLLRKS